MKKHGAIFVLSILAVLSFTTSMAIAECGDICVNETGWWCDGGEFNPSGTPIQDAIDNAATCCGDFSCVDPCIICVTDGSYTENVDVTTANLVIKSEHGADSTTVNAANTNDHVFYVHADCITLDGFEIIGATIDAYGVNLSYGDSCTIKNNHIRSNEDGIYAEYSDNLIVENNVISDNDDDGIHGIYKVEGVTTISGNIIYDNGVDGIGSIEYIHGDLNICDNEIFGNDGDGIYVIYDVDGETTITDNEIYSNGEGGIYFVYEVDGVTTISSNKIYDNGDSGIEDISELYNDLNICDNEIYGNGYVGLYGDDGICDIYKVEGVTTVSGNKIHDNSDSGIGLIYGLSGSVTITGNTITNNALYGISLSASSNNLIYNNYFDNTNNAQDDGTNIWNITPTLGGNIIGGSWLGGNYWSDYAGKDEDGDGLGDTMRPYDSSGNIQHGGDWHPLVEVATSLPDLKITDIWICWPENCTICYNVTNIGTGTALAGHNTSLFVDGTEKECNCVTEALSPNESYIWCFDFTWVYTPTEDNITVCADCNNTVSESNESNNFRTKKWICGDPNEDGRVDTTDVIAVWDYFTAGISLKNKWAADTALDNGVIDTNDVIAIWNNYVSGSVLNCSCSS